MAREYQIPGGAFVNDDAARQFQVPGGEFLDATGASAALSLTAGAGSFALTGGAATFLAGAVLAAGSGTFALSGKDVSLVYSGTDLIGRQFQLSGGPYLNQGSLRQYQVSGGPYVNEASTVSALLMAAERGTFALSGRDVGLAYSGQRSIAADTATPYVLTGFAANLVRGYRMVASGATFVFSGAPSLSDVELDADRGTFTFTGRAATLKYGKGLVAARGAFVFTGISAEFSFNQEKRVDAERGIFALTGQAVTLRRSHIAPVNSGFFVVTFNPAGFVWNRNSVSPSDYKGKGRWKGPYISDPFRLKKTRFPS